MLTNGYIKLHRQLLNWEWYDDIPTTRLFIHLLLTVNLKDSKWHGVDVPAGARIVSIDTLAKESGLSNRQIRTGLTHLEATGTVTRSKYPKFTVISMVNWSEYQTERQAKRQANDKQSDKVATGYRQQNKNIKEDNKKKEIGGGAPEWAPPAKGTPEYDAWRNQ